MKRTKYSFKLIGFGKYERIETEIEEPRKLGFYWVKYAGSDRWTVAEWHGKYWECLYDSATLLDTNFDLIHEERIEEPSY